MTVVTRVPPSTQLQQTGVMAILRARSAERFLDVSRVLVESGVTCLEITLTSPGALESIAAVRAELPDTVDIGAGTVTTAAEAHDAIAAGAGFVVSPSTEPDVIAAALEAGVPSYPGAFTATEVLSAWRAGASVVKLFPAATLGPSYVRHLSGPFPQVAIMPTGGVGLADIGAWIAAGVVGVGLGGPLLGDAAGGGDLDALADRAKRALGEVAAARRATAPHA